MAAYDSFPVTGPHWAERNRFLAAKPVPDRSVLKMFLASGFLVGARTIFSVF